MPANPVHPPRTHGYRLAILAAMVGVCGCNESGVRFIGVSTSSSDEDAARLALAELRGASGSVLPDLDSVFLAESTNRAAPAIENARQLVEVPGLIAVVGHSNSASSMAAAPIYDKGQVVQIAPTTSAVAFARSSSFSFSLVPPDDEQGRFLADQVAADRPGGGRVAVLYVNDDYGRGLRASFLESLDRDRFSVVVDLPHNEDVLTEADLQQTAGALESGKPDVVVWLSRGSTLARFIEAVRGAVPEVPIVGSDALGAGGIDAPTDERWRNVRYVGFLDLNGTEELRRFARVFAERFGVPATDSGALTYDAVGLVLAGLREGAHTGEALRDYLMSLGRDRPPYPGITGPITFDDQGAGRRAYVLQALGPDGSV